MEAVRLLEVGYDVPADQRLTAGELVELTMDPADALITRLMQDTKGKGSSSDAPTRSS